MNIPVSFEKYETFGNSVKTSLNIANDSQLGIGEISSRIFKNEEGSVFNPTIRKATLLQDRKDLDAQQSVDDDSIHEKICRAFCEKDFSLAHWCLLKGGDSALQSFMKSDQYGDILSWLKIMSIAEEPKPENIDLFALHQGGGYKYANLKILEAKAKAISRHLDHCEVAVPPFLSISHFEMATYLDKKLPEIFLLWSEFLKSFPLDQKERFCQAKNSMEAASLEIRIPLQGKQILHKIRMKILAHFDHEGYENPKMMDWLENTNPSSIMIRSTGKEDSDSITNAGGNHSVPYVLPTTISISSAIGKVIASYFSKKSLTQRFFAGDKSIFSEEKPFLPVLLQEMVEEPRQACSPEYIPRSGVLFTMQPDKAEGVTFIQVGIGNNEGVVNSHVRVDSYFVKDETIKCVIRDKESRYGLLEDKSKNTIMGLVKNKDPLLRYSEALSPQIIFDLKKIADQISELYGNPQGSPKPMEIEFTVKLKEGEEMRPTIYLLQARPMLKSICNAPSYLDLTNFLEWIEGEVVLDGGTDVKKVENPQDIIIVDTLAKAIKSIAPHVKVVVTRIPSLATSHEVVTLRPKGICVLTVRSSDAFLQFKKKAQLISSRSPLLVDTQRGVMVQIPSEMDPNQMIKEGLISYPLPLEMTLPPSKIRRILETNSQISDQLRTQFLKEAEELISKLLMGRENKHAETNDLSIVRGLLEIIATGSVANATLALASTLQILKNIYLDWQRKYEFTLISETMGMSLLQLFETAIDLSKKELIPALEQYPAQAMNRLYPLKFLEAVIFQNPLQEVLGAASINLALSRSHSLKESLKVAEEYGILLHSNFFEILSFLDISKMSFSDQTATEWKFFLKALSLLPSEMSRLHFKDLTVVIHNMKKIDMLSLWLNTVFKETWTEGTTNGEPITIIMAKLKQSAESCKRVFKWISPRLSYLKILETEIPNWSNPLFVKKNTKRLMNQFKKIYGIDPAYATNSLKTEFEQAPRLGKIGIVQMMDKAVVIFDLIVKTVKGSFEFKCDKEKALAFGELLRGFFEMQKIYFQLISINDQEEMMRPEMGKPFLFSNFISKFSTT